MNPNLPPFPEGSHWAELAPVPYDDSRHTRNQRLSGLIVLWASVLAFVAMAFAMVHADSAIASGTNGDDIGMLDGVEAVVIVVLAVVFGLLPMTMAVSHSLAVARRKVAGTRRAAGVAAVYTAICGGVAAPLGKYVTNEADKTRRITASAIDSAHHLYLVVAMLAFIPLVLFLISFVSGPFRNGRL